MKKNSSGSASKMQPKHKVAFLGGGYDSAVGQTHRIAIEMDRHFELVAGCFSQSTATNSLSAELYGINPDRAYNNLEELLQNEAENIDALVILTPTDQHTPQVLSAVSAGIPVICEKALATSSNEAQEIKALLEEKKGFLSVTYNYTGYPMLRELKFMIEQGHFGKIQQIQIEMPQEGFAKLHEDGTPIIPQDWRLKDINIPNISLDLGVHLHIMVRFLTNERPLEVVALSESFGNFHQIIDSVSFLARYSNNMHCNVWYTKTALGYRNGLKIRLFGEKMAAEWLQEDPEHLHVADHFGGRRIIDRASNNIHISSLPRYTRFKAGHPAGFIEAFANYYADVADALTAYKNNDTTPGQYAFGIDESIEGLNLFESVSESSINKKWVKVR